MCESEPFDSCRLFAVWRHLRWLLMSKLEFMRWFIPNTLALHFKCTSYFLCEPMSCSFKSRVWKSLSMIGCQFGNFLFHIEIHLCFNVSGERLLEHRNHIKNVKLVSCKDDCMKQKEGNARPPLVNVNFHLERRLAWSLVE